MTTWTPAVQQSETWTSEAPSRRVFDPHVFARSPIYDTGSSAGVWDNQAKQAETWTVE